MGFRYRLNSQGASLLLVAILNASCNGPAGPTPVNVVLSTTSIAFLDSDSQPVTIINRGNEPIEWRIHSSSASWLNASPAIGSVGSRGSGTFTVYIDRRAVSQGIHTAALQIKAGSDVLSLNVTVEENAAEPFLDPSSLELGPLAETGIIEVVNPGPSPLEWNLVSSAPWATLDPSAGNVPPGERTRVIVTVDRTGITVGNYVGTLHLSSRAGSRSATMTIEVGGTASIHLEPALLSFGLSNTQLPLRIVNDGYEPLNWNAQRSASWVSLSTTGGQVPPRSSALVAVSVNRTGLTHGLHQAGIQFLTNAGAAAAAVTTMAVPTGPSPPPPPPSLGAAIDIQPKSLDFGESATELSLLIFNTGDEALDWTGSSDKGWGSIAPSSGRVSPHSSAPVAVRVLRSGLTAGVHQTAISFSSNGGSASTLVKMGVASNTPIPDPDPDPDPQPEPGPAQIDVSPASLDFGSVTTELDLVVKNKGGSPLDWSGQVTSGWLTLSSTSGRVSPGTTSPTITVRALRSELAAAGVYKASIALTSSGGVLVVPVVLQVPSSPPSAPKLTDIDASGTKDVTKELNAYLASVPDGSVIEFPAGAKYRAEGTILLRDRRNLTIEGNGALIFAITDGSGVPPPPSGPGRAANWPRTRFHVEIDGGSGIVIRNLSVRGANPNAGMGDAAYVSALEAQHAFNISRASDIELDRVRATDVYGDFVYIGGGYGEVWSENIHIHDSHFERNGRQGIAITRGRDVLIEDNYINDTRRATFDFEPSSIEGGALDVVIRNNVIGQGRLKFIASDGRGPNISYTVNA